MSASTTLFYIHDPMCSWCWGYRPTWTQIETALVNTLSVQYVLGGLAPDTDDPMPKELQMTIQGYWRTIHAKLGTEFNFDFWQQCQPRRSTYPACRAVIAAKLQGFEMQMIEAIQHAYYLRAMNPSDLSTLQQLAIELVLDEELFSHDIISAQTELELQRQIEFVRQSPNKGFPGLLLQKEAALTSIPVNYVDASETIDLIKKYI